eukprot:4522103-Pyramimonas_sp.AAC.1
MTVATKTITTTHATTNSRTDAHPRRLHSAGRVHGPPAGPPRRPGDPRRFRLRVRPGCASAGQLPRRSSGRFAAVRRPQLRRCRVSFRGATR